MSGTNHHNIHSQHLALGWLGLLHAVTAMTKHVHFFGTRYVHQSAVSAYVHSQNDAPALPATAKLALTFAGGS